MRTHCTPWAMRAPPGPSYCNLWYILGMYAHNLPIHTTPDMPSARASATRSDPNVKVLVRQRLPSDSRLRAACRPCTLGYKHMPSPSYGRSDFEHAGIVFEIVSVLAGRITRHLLTPCTSVPPASRPRRVGSTLRA